ncbi:MAG: hypothetical protein WBG86_00930 [Polyangiales bacterium]
MNRLTILLTLIASLTMLGCTSDPEGAARTEAAEDLEESAGDEAELIGDNPDDMDGWDPAGGEIEAEMEAEPYPE